MLGETTARTKQVKRSAGLKPEPELQGEGRTTWRGERATPAPHLPAHLLPTAPPQILGFP